MEKNIFEAAAKKLGRKSKKKISGETPAPPTAQAATKSPFGTPLKHRDPEINEMLQKIDTMQQDLQNKMEDVKQRTGLSDEDIKAFMENPKNFSPADWEKMAKSKEMLGEKVWTALGMELKPKQHTRENLSSERKGKTLGARKKWIPIH